MNEQNKDVDGLAETKPLPKIPVPNSEDETQKMRTLAAQEIEQILTRKRLPE